MLRCLALHEALAPQPLQQPAQLAEIEIQLGAQRARRALAAHADGALYTAKHDGRNRTVKFRAAAA